MLWYLLGVFEEQTQKIYDTAIDRLNNVFSKRPFFSTLVLCVAISVVIVVVSADYRKGEATVKVLDAGDSISTSSHTGKGFLDSGGLVSKESEELVVDLSGAVKKPGVYRLKPGDRLGELLALGGGFVSEVSSLWVSKNLNLSQGLSDGQKVYIPFDWDIDALSQGEGVGALSLGVVSESSQRAKVAAELSKMQVITAGSISSSGIENPESSGSSGSGGSAVGNSGELGDRASVGNLVNMNTATSAELDALPGIGPAYAGRIIENRPYSSFEEFKEKSGLSAKLVDSLKDLISF